MQIHELTQQKITQIDEGIADTIGGAVGKGVSGIKNVGQAVAAPFKDVAGGYKSGRQDQQISAMADKVYRAWKGYEGQLLKADPDARANGQLKKSLLAFVQKNLLGNMQLSNITNKDKIIGVVDQISGATTPTATQQASAKQHTGGKVAGQLSQTPGAVAKRDARAKAAQAQTAGAGAFGQMANQLGGTKPNTMATAPVSKVNVASPTNPNQPQQTPLQQATALHQQVQGQKPATTLGKVPSGATTPVKVKGATKAGAPTPAEYEKLQQKIAAASKKTPTMNEALPTIKPTVKPVGSLAARAKQRNAPATPAPATPAPATPAPATKTATAPVTKTATTATTPTQVAPATPAPANEKELFKQLVQYAALAATDVDPTKAPATRAGNGTQVRSTGNPQADKVLTDQGFVVV